MPVAGPTRYWHTLRHLKPVQLYGRVLFKVSRPRVDHAPAPARRTVGTWIAPACGRASMTGPESFCFLSQEHALGDTGWNPAHVSKLWVYNLHYFADLCAQGASSRSAWHTQLIERWIRENQPGTGNGWEPYPTSLRICNWIKWTLAGNTLTHADAQSLATQVRWLAKRLEWHIQGNHLFVNAKALVMAGLFFQGPEAEQWLQEGAAILTEQIPEQILPDGGQFERSPMYHALALEDMLDLFNALRAYSSPETSSLSALVSARIQPMRRWLSAMCHPDGEISFFNDSAIGIAPAPAELHAYAERLGFAPIAAPVDGVEHLEQSGYIRVQQGGMVALLDVAPVGPDYLPGHAHADTLSCELSLYGKRVLVNSGTSQYGGDAERQRQRGTAAHNTVVVDDQDSSEVWGGFRVARRAMPVGLSIQREGHTLQITCSHDGYQRLPCRATHTRQWNFSASKLSVKDTISHPKVPACSMWHFGPDIQLLGAGPYRCTLAAGHELTLGVDGATHALGQGTWHPEFGMSVPTALLTCTFAAESQVWMEWT
jgi:uncharacterized heparinase superfamily protein